MTPVEAQAYQQAVLFLSALLESRSSCDHRVRSSILAQAHLLSPVAGENIPENLKNIFRSAGITDIPAACLRPSSIERAEARAALWSSLGVWAFDIRDLKSSHASFPDVPRVWFAFGNRGVLDRPSAAILNSRKPRHLSPADPWIATTKTMVCCALRRGFAVVSGYGTPAYDMVAALARGWPLVVVCDTVLPFMDSAEALDRFSTRYGDLFESDDTVFVSGFPPGRVPSQAVRYFQRDCHVAALSSLLMVADVRPHGNMAAVLNTAAQSGIPVYSSPLAAEHVPDDAVKDDKILGAAATIRPPSKKAPSSPMTSPADQSGLPRARQLARKTSYLMHYTRSCAGPWPGQTIAQYCRTLIEGSPGAAHTGFDSLVRILEEGTIRASGKLTRGARKVVCFTELFPDELQSLHQWRPGLLRWSFEPYAIALNRDMLFALGARPVIYAVEALYEDLSDDLRYLFQLHGSRTRNWAEEREWRIAGDLVFEKISREEMFVIVPTGEQATIISQRFNVRVGLAADL